MAGAVFYPTDELAQATSEERKDPALGRRALTGGEGGQGRHGFPDATGST